MVRGSWEAELHLSGVAWKECCQTTSRHSLMSGSGRENMLRACRRRRLLSVCILIRQGATLSFRHGSSWSSQVHRAHCALLG